MLGERIAELRKNRKISQEELADILCTSRQAVSKWERGESDPDIDRLKDLAAYFNVSIDYLLGYDVESNSVDAFIKRLNESAEKGTFDVDIDEIKMVVSRNINNFRLYSNLLDYLFGYYSLTRETSIADMIIEYSKKAILLYQPDNKENVKLGNLQRAIVYAYSLQKKYDLARDYIKENDVPNVESELAACEYQLGNVKEASKIASEIFLKSVMDIINGNTLQVTILLKNNEVEEAYDLSKWCISFIQSVKKKENLFLEVIIILYITKAMCENHLGLDYMKTVKTIEDGIKKTNNRKEDSGDIKYYYNKKESFFYLNDSVELEVEKGIEQLKDTEIYNDACFIKNEVFGGKEK